MPAPSTRGVLLDIEGTTSSIAFVTDVLFPYARAALESFLAENWSCGGLAEARDIVAREAGHASFAEWCDPQSAEAPRLLRAEVERLMDADAKTTGLKVLQGMIWRAGFLSGELISHVWDDVPGALERWRRSGLDVRIFSSGSVEAQKLFFTHTEHGDLSERFTGHYDTRVGAKREPSSYRAIAEDWGLPAASILFVSDVVAELDAAREAGMQTALALRPGNASASEEHGHAAIRSFDEIK